MLDIRKRLEMIKNGILTEAEDEPNYDIPNGAGADTGGSSESDTPTDTNTGTSTTDGGDEGSADSNEPNYDISSSDNEDGGSDGSDPQTSDNTSDPNSADTGSTSTPGPKEGEVLQLDPTSRALLIYKNFKTYRTLRDEVSTLLSELTETPTFNTMNRAVIDKAIEKAKALEEKLTDYIVYKYKENSYEVNFKNFADFIIEKRLIIELIDTLSDTTNK